MGNISSEEVRITGIILDEVGQPRNDGTPGSGLYEVPFQLSQAPGEDWSIAFIDAWNSPPEFTSMHRPGIARVEGDRIILDGTTIEEVERWHLRTLKLCVQQANQSVTRFIAEESERERSRNDSSKRHHKHIEEVARRLKFD
ncbi:MAG: hypothetical protein ACREQR_05885 [Candidatus Binataceae bacterium]